MNNLWLKMMRIQTKTRIKRAKALVKPLRKRVFHVEVATKIPVIVLTILRDQLLIVGFPKLFLRQRKMFRKL